MFAWFVRPLLATCITYFPVGGGGGEKKRLKKNQKTRHPHWFRSRPETGEFFWGPLEQISN